LRSSALAERGTHPLHDALPISVLGRGLHVLIARDIAERHETEAGDQPAAIVSPPEPRGTSCDQAALPGRAAMQELAIALVVAISDRKSTRLNSSHRTISYAVSR